MTIITKVMLKMSGLHACSVYASRYCGKYLN